MRLNKVTVRNYRIHKETVIEFDPKLTLISGPNESGKSTLAEAIHRALFLRAKGTSKPVEDMRSDWGGVPSVELEFSAGVQDVKLDKKFSGTGGSVVLTIAGQPVLQSDDADEKLAGLLHVGGPVGGRGAAGELPSRWAHLWVWQGKAGDSPTGTVAEQQSILVQRLQAKGGAAITQSDLDARVLREIRERYNALFTERGDPKTGSDLAKAGRDLAEMKDALAKTEQAVNALEEAASRYSTAESEIAGKTRAVRDSVEELSGVEEGLKQADELKRKLDPILHLQEEAAAGFAAQEKIESEITATRQARDNALQALGPREKALVALRLEQESCRDARSKAEKAWEAARATASIARQWQNAMEAHRQALEKHDELKKLKANQATITDKRKELQSVCDEMALTPAVGQKDLTTLQKLRQELAIAEASCAALGARIKVLASREPVTVDGHPVAAGASVEITCDAEVTIGSVATLRIGPGGGAGIAEARQAVEKARQKYREKLGALGIATPEVAIEAHEKLRALETRIGLLKAELDRLDADGNEQVLRECEQSQAEASRRAEMTAGASGRPLPAAGTEVKASCRDAGEDCRQAETAEKVAEEAFRTARKISDEMDTRATAANAGAEELRRQAKDAEVRIGVMEEQQGNDQVRARKRLDLRSRLDQARAEQALLQGKLDELQPAQLAQDAVRLKTAITRAREDIQSAEQRKAAAGALLNSSGLTDPHEELQKARAACERSESRHAGLRGQAEALKLLNHVAAEIEKNVMERINQPLEEAARGYLECIFGIGARVVLEGSLQGGATPSLRVNRESAGFGTFEFSDLSGGAKEQVGIAMRLAMAEVLAEAHDGCLPIVLDDAFANSDPDRVKVLQRMLYLAAEKGLQVIVLTCNPSHYATLGAREVRLERPRLLRGAPSMPDPAETRDPDEAPAEAGVSAPVAGDAEAFLEKLGSMSGKSGNQTLREALSWNQERYDEVKNALLAEGRIGLGQGRGGSVRLV
jgi:DNA repair exonuclease SbcCD ATPase subunit